METPSVAIHLIPTLQVGGAERFVASLVRPLADQGVRSVVVPLLASGPVAEAIVRSGATVRPLREVREVLRGAGASAVLVGWMYWGGVASGALSRWSGRPHLIAIRHGLSPDFPERRSTRLGMTLCARAARSARTVIYQSEAIRAQHETQLGFPASIARVIPNGFDPAAWPCGEAVRQAARAALGIPATAHVLGTVGRAHPNKRLALFLDAAAIQLDHDPDCWAVAAGRGVPALLGPSLALLPKSIRARIVLHDELATPGTLYPAIDVICSTSIAEGFPNTLAEAALSGALPLATAPEAFGDFVDREGERMPDARPAQIAEAMRRGLSRARAEGDTGRRHRRQGVVAGYALSAVAAEYADAIRRARR